MKEFCFIGVEGDVLQDYIVDELVTRWVSVQCCCGAIYFNLLSGCIFRVYFKFTDSDRNGCSTGARHVENDALAGMFIDVPATRCDHTRHVGTVDIDGRVVREFREVEGLVVAGEGGLDGSLSCHSF